MQFRTLYEKPFFFGLILLFSLFLGCSKQNKAITVFADTNIPQVEFALEELKNVFHAKELQLNFTDSKNADIVIAISPEAQTLKSEGFQLKNNNGKFQVTGFDAAGAMYGTLELAEQININGLDGVEETSINPYMERRGTKFNIPLDLRTPSYSDMSDSGQKNIAEMWNFDFWKAYIDDLARYRYNYISLWNLHPFPSMVKVTGYEDVALDDIQRATHKFDEYYHTSGLGFCSPEILANPEILKKISIDEKIEFWKKVMAYGKSRNVDFYVITWNIFVHGAKDKYGITDKIDNAITRDYFRKSVKQMFVTYPDLGGIGLTTGENMRGIPSEEREEWAFDSYALGLMDAAAEMPDRKFTFIHRQHQTGAKAITEKFKPLIDNENIEFLFCFKYAQAHVMSATTQPFHENYVKDIAGMKTLWTLRNDDNYYFRWGAPDFVREFINNMPYEVSRGYHYGSDGWVWGREFTSKNASAPRQIELDKHWYHWMLWGRLGYDPKVSNDRFVSMLQTKFPTVDATKFFTAWQEASMIYPTTTGFHWGPFDFQWYIEACKSRERYAQNDTGFHDVNRFINLPPHAKSGFQSIPDYVKMTLDDSTSTLKNPFEVSGLLHAHSDTALQLLEEMNAGDDKKLQLTIHDIKTMALLGKYYAHKIAGSTQVALYRKTKEKKFQEKAVVELEEALHYWKRYTKAALQQNVNPIWSNRVGDVDWAKITDWVAQDIAIAKEK